jgi:hypothetical protein
VFFGRDLNPLFLSPYPSTESNAARAEFRKLFNAANASPEETFESAVADIGDPNNPAPQVFLLFPTIGQVTFASRQILFQVEKDSFFNRTIDMVLSGPLSITFEVPVVAVGFYMIDLEISSGLPIDAFMDGVQVTTFVVPHTNPASVGTLNENLAYVGLVHRGGFNLLTFANSADNIRLDYFSVFKSSDLL